MSEFKGKMEPVRSGNLNAIGHEYCDETKQGILRVEFKNGRQYEYFPVSAELYNESKKATSKGKWFQQSIKDNPEIDYEEVDPQDYA